MMAAAQAAAEAALREAMERDGEGHFPFGMAPQPQRQQQQQGLPQQQQPQQVIDHFQLAEEAARNELSQIASNEMSIFNPMQSIENSIGSSASASAENRQRAELLQELMSNPDSASRLLSNPDSAARLLELISLQSEPSPSATSFRRPEKQYLTIAHNGSILEATETVTGFQPEALLMTSAYDGVYEEDLPGFLCIKTKFWEKGESHVQAFIRRRTVEGELVWLASKAAGYVSDPIPGLILEETVVSDETTAKRFNRATRITAILVQAVEAAWVTASKKKLAAPEISKTTTTNNGEVIVGNEAISGDGTDGVEDTDASEKSFNPYSLMEAMRKGIQLDLGLTELQVEEVQLLSLVLTGKVHVDQVAPLVLEAIQNGREIKDVINSIGIDCSPPSSNNAAPRSGRRTPRLSENGRFFSQSNSNGATPVTTLGKIPQSLPNGMHGGLPPPISVLCLSCAYIGNAGVDLLSDVIERDHSPLRALDISFCGIEEKGFLALARALNKRKKKRIPALRGVVLSGNYMSLRAAGDMGMALSPSTKKETKSWKKPRSSSGYESESSTEDEDDDDDDELDRGRKSKRRKSGTEVIPKESKEQQEDEGLQVLHLASTSLTAEAMGRFLKGIGALSPVRELSLSSNFFGPAGAAELVAFFQSKQRSRGQRAKSPRGRSTQVAVLPKLDRLDLSNNNIGDEGTAQVTKAIGGRWSTVHLVDLRLSSNSIGSGGIQTLMNKLLSHNLVSLSLDKNSLGDHGCQLVAASLQTMSSLSRLDLSYNQIGSRGIISLMRFLVSCESIMYLGLSGNILKISGAVALAFTLSKHPRLEELDVDNCCLGKAAQCHIVAGIISNRWVPMKKLRGYAVGPPMVEIGALTARAFEHSNEACFRIRKDEQMKNMLQWMASNRKAKQEGGVIDLNQLGLAGGDQRESRFLPPDFIESINDIGGTPSQNAYLRLLGWLSKIPFDEDELTAHQKYFYDFDGGEGDRSSDGHINLKGRGDLLAALDSEAAEEIREELLGPKRLGSVGVDLDVLCNPTSISPFEAMKGTAWDKPPCETIIEDGMEEEAEEKDVRKAGPLNGAKNPANLQQTASKSGRQNGKPEKSSSSSKMKVMPRITMFPHFEQQLEELKANATEMIEEEDNPMQHELILTQYAETSLTVLRQLRYHCMNSGLDGWRQVDKKRKVLVVDDSAVTRKLVSHAFQKAGFVVDTAANGAEGVEKLIASLYDIAFMDIDMPVMNGLEATKKLREWEDQMRPGVRQPICALTATIVDNIERSKLMEFKEAGLDVMESKPCNIPRLFKVVDDVSPMFSDLSISVQRERSDSKLSDAGRNGS